LRDIRAKVDTGAKSSSLHVENIEELPGNKVQFEVVLSRKDSDKRKRVCADISRHTRVKSTSGEYAKRYFVKTRIKIGEIEKEIELNITNRGAMIHRMLLGRTSLEGTFLVDVSKKELLKVGKKQS